VLYNSTQASEQRQVNLQIEYINYTVEDILEKKVASTKRRRCTPADNTDQGHQVQEADNVFIRGLDESVGSFIKNVALAKYREFSSCTVTEQTVVSLGMNSLLDLLYVYNNGHSTIFDQAQLGRASK
jgi:hypothetical protein